MPRRRGASHVVDLIDFQKDWQRDVVPDQFKVRAVQQVNNVSLLAGKEIVQADHIMAVIDQPFAQVRTKETCAAGNKNAFYHERLECVVYCLVLTQLYVPSDRYLAALIIRLSINRVSPTCAAIRATASPSICSMGSIVLASTMVA